MKKALAAFGILIICLIAFLWFREVSLFAVGLDGFMYPGDEIKTSLINGGESAKNYNTVAVKDVDEVFLQHQEYFVHNDNGKERISINLPVVSNDGSRILVLDAGEAITDKYLSYKTFRGAVVADGTMYSLVDGDQVDKEKYIFIKTDEGLFMNVYKISVNVLMGERTVPTNSLIYFERNSLRFYRFNDEKTEYIFEEINGIDLGDEVELNDEKMTYEELLRRLNVWKEDKDDEPEEVEPVTPEEQPNDDGGNGKRGTTDEEIDKLEVSAKFVSADTYAATFDFYIHDPNGEIIRYPTVEIMDGNKTYARKTFYTTSDAEIAGLMPETHYTYKIYYTFKNAEGKMYQITLDEGEFDTLGRNGLETITFSHGDVVARSNDATISDLKLLNNKNDRVLRGLSKIVMMIDGQEVKFGAGAVSILKKLEGMSYTTPSILKSNTVYHFELKAYDVAGNELAVENSGIDLKTIKNSPSAKISIEETDFTWFRAKVSVTNNDNVRIQNLRYVLLDGGTILREGRLENDYKIYEDNLVDNKIYQLLIYGDYDLDDGNGVRANQLLAETNVATVSISVLGNLRLTLVKNDLSKNSAEFQVGINTRTTDARLTSMLSFVEIDLFKDGDLVKTYSFSSSELSTIKSGDSILMRFTGLDSNTNYTMEGRAKFRQGDTEYDTETVLSIRSFVTMKKPAQVEVIDKFTTASMIDYTVRIVDPDGSITSDRVIMNAERVNGSIVGAADLPINGDYQRFTYNKLDNNTNYEITFIAERYNEGFTDITAESGKTLTSFIMRTADGVSGDISLESLLRQREGKNHYEIDNLQRWKDVSAGGSDTSTTTNRRYDRDGKGRQVTFLSVKNGWRTYSYFLPELAGKRVTVSFDAKKEVVGSDTFLARVANDDTAITSCTLNGISTEYQHYSCSFTLGAKGYVGFYLSEVSAQNRLTEIAIRNLQIEESATETEYEPYRGKTTFLATVRVNMADLRREIPGNDYYIKVYKFDELVQEIREGLDSDGLAIEKYTGFDVDLNATYTAKLVARIDGVDYEISSTEFTTEQEIRSVRTLAEFRNMHISGKYYVIEDIDFRGLNNIFPNFYGEIDFQGNRMDMNVAGSYLFNNFYGVFKNVDLHVYLDSPSSSVFRWHWGFSQYNYGTLENLFITIEESIPGSAYYSVAVLSRNNYGTVNNFVIHMKVSMYGIHSFSPCILENYGVIKNGYAYGDEGVSLEPHYDKSYESNPKYVGVFAARLRGNGRLENVYSLVNVDGDINIYSNNALEIVGNLVGYADAGATMSHVYSNADGKDRNLAADINWHPGSGYNPADPSNYFVEKMYYVLSEEREALGQDFAQKGSVKISPWALRDTSFQNDVLNTYNSFDVNNYVKYGYYPHIIFPEVMPRQDYIPLPVPSSDEAPDVVAVTNIEREDTSSALVTLSVRNYYQRNITSIRIRKLTTEIVEQTHRDRYTKLVIRVSNPTQYLSSYSVESISNGTVTTYGENERIIDVKMQKEINSINDWKQIKSRLNENHILMVDLDFTNVAVGDLRVTGNFKGELDGNGHTISNISIPSGDTMFVHVYGTIKDLFVENYSKTGMTEYAGLASTAQRGGKFSNVHMKNVNVLGNQYIGGLVGYMDGATIENCSVSGMTLYNIDSSYNQAQLGGIAGYMANSSTIRNSFARDIDFDIRKAPNIYTVGGLVGRLASGTIDSVYTTGRIQTKTPSNGGVVGQAENYGTLSHVYSTVDIFTTSNVDIGGIVGEATNPSHYVVSNTLSAGAIYSSLSGGTVRRTIGGDIVVNQANYAWRDQHINGVITDEISGEILLSTEELNMLDTYTRTIGLGEGFSYDGIGDNSLPLLYAMNTNTLLPNQEKTYFKTYDFEVSYIEIQQGVDVQGTDNAWIYMEIKNPEEVEISGITIEDVTVKQVSQNRNTNGMTYYRMEINPKYYYDSYRLSEIKYKVDGVEYTVSKDTKIEMQFFRDIWNVQDWQRIEKNSSENYRLRADIDFSGVNDINHDLYINRMDGFENGYTLSNITINENGNNIGLFHVINSSLYNITFNNVNIKNTASSRNTGIVLFGYGRAEKLIFNNINIDAKSCNYTGIIADNFASDTRDITINNSSVYGLNQVGGYSGRIKPFSVTTVSINDTTVNGSRENVGGFAGEQWTANYLLQYGITVNHGTISGRSYVGGIYGKGAGSSLTVTGGTVVEGTKNNNDSFVGGISGRVNMSVSSMGSNTVENTTIKASGQYIGGIAGYGDKTITTSTVKNTTIDGKGTGYRVGGIAGAINGSYSITNSKVGGETDADKVIIQNTAERVGGIAGGNAVTSNNVVNHATISASGNYVGGITGVAWTTSNSAVLNSSVTGNSYVGGAVGYTNPSYAISNNAVVKTTVSAATNAGGLAGGCNEVTGSFTTYNGNTVNATSVTTSGENAGGLIGYLNNKEYTREVKGTLTYYTRQRAYSNIVENVNVSASINAAGLIGRIDVSVEYADGLQVNRFYNNIISANSITTTNETREPGVLFGNDDSLAYRKDGDRALRATGNKIYENIKMIKNGGTPVLAKDYTGNNFDMFNDKSTKMINLTNLKTASTYTSAGININTSQLNNGYYPYINLSMATAAQLLVALPSASLTNTVGAGLNSLSMSRMMTSGVSYHVMPTYNIYTSGVNTINVEFSNVDDETMFTLNGNEYAIENRTYSFNYNFDQPIEFSMTDGQSEKTETIEPSALRGTLATIGDYYYIMDDDGSIITNEARLPITAKNVFNNKVLTVDNKIIDLKTGNETDVNDYEVDWIGKALPLYKFELNGSELEVFSGYTLVDGENILNKQIIVKGAQTEIINANVNNKKSQIILDSFNNKDYLTVLGTDGVIYDFKTKLTYPENFTNEKIIEISNNVEDFTRMIIVRYESGKVVVFDYRNGNVIYKIMPSEIPTPFDYFVEQVTAGDEKMYDDVSLTEGQEKVEKLTDEIRSGTVVSKKNEISPTGNYITSYNPVKDEYEIFELGELLKVDPLGVETVSISDKIYGDNTLNSMFGHFLAHDGDNNVAIIVIYVGIGITITVSMIALGDLLRRKYSYFNENGVKWK